MSPTLAVNLAATPLSADALLGGALVLCVSALVGFVAGVLYERAAARRALTGAARQLSRLVQVVLNSLESAREACAALDTFPNLALSSQHLQRLKAKQSSLVETLARVVDNQQALIDVVAQQTLPKADPVPFQISWQRDADAAPDVLPDRALFDANLELLLAAGRDAGVESGLLFIKVDKFEQLQGRFGPAGAATLLRKMAAAVCRAGRDEDLLCRYSADTLALLMPQIDAPTGRLLAQRIRDSVRSFHFRLDESGPEVFMSASYGLTMCDPADHPDLAVNRAGNAVARSQRRGRNQLHLHDGETAVHCLAG